MKKVISTLLIVFCFQTTFAQSWQWARQAGFSAANNEVLGTSISNTGDVFLCGYYQTTLNIGTATTLTVNFPGDYLDYVAKYNAAGVAQWVRNITGVVPDACAALDISSDAAGNCYVVYGHGYAFATPGSIFNYASSYGGFHYLKKINSTGADVWTQNPTFGTNSACTFESIKTDAAGNSYLTGAFTGTVTFGSITLTSPGVEDAFVVMYDNSGFVNYAVQATGGGGSIGHSIDVDANGYAVIVGEFQSGITFGTTSLTSNGQRDYFIARLDPLGNFIWAKSDGSAFNDELYGVAIDNPRIYVTGNFNDNFTMGSLAVNTHGGQDILVACTDTSGNELWAVANGGGSSDDIGYDIATDHNGGVYASGNYNGPATFGGTNLTGANGAYIVKYDIISIQQWVKKVVGTSMSASGKSVSASTNTEIAMGGSFCCYGSTIDFSGSNISLSPNGGPGNYGAGFYISKIGNCSMVANAGPDVSINCSDTIALSATGGSTYTWTPSTGLNTTSGANVLANPVVTTTYTVTASDSTGCSATDAITVTVTGGPLVSVTGDTTICIGLSTQLTASGASTYTWVPATGLNNATIANPIATPNDTTTYTVTGTDAFGCATSLPVTIIVNPLPAVPVITPNLNILTSTSAVGYQWNLNGGPISGATNQNYTVVQNGIYTVTVTDANGCERTSAPFLFTNVGVAELKSNIFIIAIPNPLTGDAEVVLSQTGKFNHPHLRITDASGRVVSDEDFSGNKLVIKKESINSGVYFYSLLDKERVIFSDKLVVK